MKKASVLFFAAALACALVLSGCTAKRNDHDSNVNDRVTDSPLTSILPSEILPSDNGHDDDMRPDASASLRPDLSPNPSGAVEPDVSDDPIASPSTNPSGSATPSVTENP